MGTTVSRREFLRRSALLGAVAAATGAACPETRGDPEEPPLPTARIGDLDVSRLVIDSAPFLGYGHPRYLVCKAMYGYYTDEHVALALDAAARFGVNTVLGPPFGREPKFFGQYLDRGGAIRTWIGEVGGKPAAIGSAIKRLASRGPRALFVDADRTDGPMRHGQENTCERWLNALRDTNVAVGVATHRSDLVAVYEKRRFPIDFYVQTVYRSTERSPESREKAYEAARQTEKPVVMRDLLLADCTDPESELQYAFEHLGAKDAVAVPFFPQDNPGQIETCCRMVRRLCRG